MGIVGGRAGGHVDPASILLDDLRVTPLPATRLGPRRSWPKHAGRPRTAHECDWPLASTTSCGAPLAGLASMTASLSGSATSGAT